MKNMDHHLLLALLRTTHALAAALGQEWLEDTNKQAETKKEVVLRAGAA